MTNCSDTELATGPGPIATGDFDVTGQATVRLEDFFSRMWARLVWRRMIFPEPVILNRFLAPECVFIFGMVGPFWMLEE